MKTSLIENEMNITQMKYLDWDTEQLEIECGIIDFINGTENLSDLKIAESIKKVTKENSRIDFITVKLPAENIKTVNALIKSGYSLIDTELTYVYSSDISSCNVTDETAIDCKFCEKINGDIFLPLAEEMNLSRFYMDENIGKDKAERLWRSSIKNHCEGLSDQLLIAFINDEPCGMVAMKINNDNEMMLHIVGVLKKYQRMKVGQQMLKKIIDRYADKYSIKVETQSVNSAAQGLYRKTGFKFQSLKYVLHYWS